MRPTHSYSLSVSGWPYWTAATWVVASASKAITAGAINRRRNFIASPRGRLAERMAPGQ